MKKFVLMLAVLLVSNLVTFGQEQLDEVGYSYYVENDNNKNYPLFYESFSLRKFSDNSYMLEIEIADVKMVCTFKYKFQNQLGMYVYEGTVGGTGYCSYGLGSVSMENFKGKILIATFPKISAYFDRDQMLSDIKKNMNPYFPLSFKHTFKIKIEGQSTKYSELKINRVFEIYPTLDR